MSYARRPAAHRSHPLTAEQERHLARTIERGAARHRFTEANLGLVLSVANRQADLRLALTHDTTTGPMPRPLVALAGPMAPPSPTPT